MKKITTNKKTILESIAKLTVDNNAVSLYLKDKTSITTLKEKGITLTNPL
ncbi:hypothetical protein [Flavobacterium aquidurense]|nr:hypothetical protein [Flavobacterium aquidurense]MDR7370528.1 hypothetical protein [Flavobacterium aquidurense]